MGAAFAASFLQGGMLTASKLTVVEPLKEKHQHLDASLHCTVVTTLDATSASADLIFLAVKPQIYQEVCVDLAQYLHENQMVVSIMAGVSLDTLQQSLLGHKKVVRAMPNLPAQIGDGMTVFLSNPTLSEAEVRYLRDLFATSGKALEVREERLIHAATAL
ncbi:MAG: NAD(P)-binding domain-containing protein, partial [Bdellovibrionales bacterium]|nr:NAD(P)-binding domain-containing protein [Bdellovibrionales bacterium]